MLAPKQVMEKFGFNNYSYLSSESTVVNLSTSSWDPSPGLVSVEVLIIDSNGLLLYSESTSHIARQSGWNLKLSTLRSMTNLSRLG